ncbi:sugar transferase [Patescibacteria group bacterium]|nr:sugar transferase [Patescibacteria group bacterium]
MKKSKLYFGVSRLPIDFLATMGAFLLAYYIRPITDLIPGVQYNFYPELLPNFDEYLNFSLYAATFLIILFIFNKLYSLKFREKFGKVLLRIIVLVSAWLMFIIAYYFLVVHQLFFSRIALAHIWFFTIVFVTAGRILILFVESLFLRFGIGKRRILFIGVNNLADQCFKQLKKDKRFKVVGALAERVESRKIDYLKIIGTVDQLEHIVKKYGVEEIIQADEARSSELLGFCRSNQIRYYFIPDLLRIQRTNVEMEMIDDVPLISLKQTPLEGWGYVNKRLFDFLFSLIFILILIPLWIIAGIAIKIDSKGPIFYKSKRKYREKVFSMYKFRTMVADADKVKQNLKEQNERKGPLFKMKHDPRITSLGRFLRKTSIDELPQLFNVLIGNMSLVGPRPHLPEEVDQYESHHYQVFAIKPGVTGLAQINGRSNLDFEEEVKLDVYYIENWSLWLDIKIILRSIGVVFRADGC